MTKIPNIDTPSSYMCVNASVLYTFLLTAKLNGMRDPCEWLLILFKTTFAEASDFNHVLSKLY